MKRIAICFSGQLRTWEQSRETWEQFFVKIKEKTGITVDVFFHAWNFNSSPLSVLCGGTNDIAIPLVEQELLVKYLRPKNYKFEGIDISRDAATEVNNQNKKYNEVYGKVNFENAEVPCWEWAASPAYSLMYACNLKKEYENKNNFKYDVCFRMRFDLFFNDEFLRVFFLNKEEAGTYGRDLNTPEYNSCYSAHTINVEPNTRLGDVFFYANSITFDLICDFYRWLHIIGTTSFPKHIQIEQVFYYYAKMHNINVIALCSDVKICRDQNYLDDLKRTKKEVGNHEIVR